MLCALGCCDNNNDSSAGETRNQIPTTAMAANLKTIANNHVISGPFAQNHCLCLGYSDESAGAIDVMQAYLARTDMPVIWQQPRQNTYQVVGDVIEIRVNAGIGRKIRRPKTAHATLGRTFSFRTPAEDSAIKADSRFPGIHRRSGMPAQEPDRSLPKFKRSVSFQLPEKSVWADRHPEEGNAKSDGPGWEIMV